MNFKMVTVRAAEELQKRNPEKSEQQVLQSMKQGTSAVEKAIDGAIREMAVVTNVYKTFSSALKCRQTLIFDWHG
jgi:hypothetical protein